MVRYDLNLFEVWKPIPGYEGLYEVSSEGRVWSVKRKKIIKTSINVRTGYAYVSLCNQTKALHRIVLSSFYENPNPEINTDVNHKNEVKTDNRLINLEWCNRKYNINYGTGKERKEMNRKQSMISSGRWKEGHIGLSRKDYNKLYHQEHREELLKKMKEYKIRNKNENHRIITRDKGVY